MNIPGSGIRVKLMCESLDELECGHSFSQPPVHLCFAQAIKPIAHTKVTLILSFSWGFSSKVAFCTS